MVFFCFCSRVVVWCLVALFGDKRLPTLMTAILGPAQPALPDGMAWFTESYVMPSMPLQLVAPTPDNAEKKPQALQIHDWICHLATVQ